MNAHQRRINYRKDLKLIDLALAKAAMRDHHAPLYFTSWSKRAQVDSARNYIEKGSFFKPLRSKISARAGKSRFKQMWTQYDELINQTFQTPAQVNRPQPENGSGLRLQRSGMRLG